MAHALPQGAVRAYASGHHERIETCFLQRAHRLGDECIDNGLLHGQRDEASYAVPASFVLDEDLSQLIPVLHGAPASAYPARPEQVLRLSGNVSSGATFGFLGLPAARLAQTS